MFFARYFPGLGITADVLAEMTPEETGSLRRVGLRLLKNEGTERLTHTKIIAAAAGMRLR